MRVELREVSRENLDAVLNLEVGPAQRGFVASNAKSIAQAHFYADIAWFRAIYADDVPVGFVMLAFEPDKPPYLWRLMVDHRHQGRGIGRAAMGLIVAHLRETRPEAAELLLSHVPGEGDPGPFYAGLGFTYTGVVDDGERVMRLPLAPALEDVPSVGPDVTAELSASHLLDNK